LATLGRALVKVAEALAAAAVVFFTVWLIIKSVVWALRQTITHWRTSVTLIGLGAWWHWSVWRVPDGHWVHLCVTGELSNGLTIEIYRSVPFTRHGIGADLAPRSRITVELAALRVLAAPEQVTL
jgi:hypothetical protein